MTTLLAAWIIVVSATLALAVYRKLTAFHEDPYLHLSQPESGQIAGQSRKARRIASLDRVGIILTAISAISGIVLAIAFLYQQFNARI